jgi:hypothetical protein
MAKLQGKDTALKAALIAGVRCQHTGITETPRHRMNFAGWFW